MNTQHPTTGDAKAPMQQLSAHLRDRHGDSITGILFYGSCLRSGKVFDGLVDLYLIIDDYRSFYGLRWQALANWLLPPNVFYIELPIGDQTLRCKYTVISAADFQRGATRWFETYIWGRFTQPVEVLYSRDEPSLQHLKNCLQQSSVTFLNRTLPALPDEGTVEDLWQAGLKLSYGVEFRAESSGRAKELIDSDRKYYETQLQLVSGQLKYRLDLNNSDGGLRYRAQVPGYQRLLAKLAWPLRRTQGKTLSLFRLLKALFTFEGGLDYLAWKLERHSGQKVAIPDRVRRYPLIFIWGLFIQLYRRGVFR